MVCRVPPCVFPGLSIERFPTPDPSNCLDNSPCRVSPGSRYKSTAKHLFEAIFQTGSESSQIWIHQNFSQFRDDGDIKVALKFEVLKMPDAISQILTQTFWCKVHGQAYFLNDKLKSIGAYWKERECPKVKLSPLGGGKIEWYWQLDSHERPDGILHVGVDLKTRMFLCYEINKGIYFPTGMVLERIRSEIVQNEVVAGDRLGKGYLDKTSKE